jgi:hypothetical protein
MDAEHPVLNEAIIKGKKESNNDNPGQGRRGDQYQGTGYPFLP